MTDFKQSNLQDLDIDLDEIGQEYEQDMKMLEEIKQKDKEIIKLREELCELRSKQPDKKILQEQEAKIEKLKLELKHSLEQQEHIQKQCEIKV